ncbi:uncharacterized protein BKA78DRAFT_343156 [Phyllosticta capitalensis]|uniref:Uncharacterized protein n=1 Tax=Phyllosticta capitalensis TaxID=121624 RepID=A0ABR1YWX6_9PEZI
MHGHWMACRKKCQWCNGSDHVGKPCAFQSEDFYRQNTCRSIIYGRRVQADEPYDSGCHGNYSVQEQHQYMDNGDEDTHFVDDPPVPDTKIDKDELLTEIELLRENVTAAREENARLREEGRKSLAKLDRLREQHRPSSAADRAEVIRLRELSAADRAEVIRLRELYRQSLEREIQHILDKDLNRTNLQLNEELERSSAQRRRRTGQQSVDQRGPAFQRPH